MTADERQQFFLSAHDQTAYLSVDVDGATYLVRTEDHNVGMSLFVKRGRGEMSVLRRATALVLEAFGDKALGGTQFLDVGANIGTTTIAALVGGPFATAMSFEPEPTNLRDLRLNLLLNGLEERASAMGVALSDSVGIADFVASTDRSGQGWIALDDRRLDRHDSREQATTVPTTTLDALIEAGIVDPAKVGMLWMDVQAHEGHVLAGAGRLLEHGIPTVIEWYPRFLDELGDRGKLQDSVADHFTHFIDLRSLPNDGESPVREASALAEYVEPFAGVDGTSRFTDILVLRLAAGTAEKLNVAKVLHRRKPRAADVGKVLRHRKLREAERAAPPASIEAMPKAGRSAEELKLLRERKRSPEAAARREAKRVILAEDGDADPA